MLPLYVLSLRNYQNNLRPDLDMTRAAGTARPKVQHRLARTELRQGSRVSAP
jgi:hypothetical protein